MILILSQSSLEPTTDCVIDWIHALGGRWMRVNGEDLDGGSDIFLEFSTERDDLRLCWQGSELPLAEVAAVWFRRWVRERRHDQCNLTAGPAEGSDLRYQIAKHLTQEGRKLSDLFFQAFADRPWLSHPKTSVPNKLSVLRSAVKAGLDVPATLVTTRRDDLIRFCSSFSRVITKPIGDVAPLIDDGVRFLMYTTIIEHDAIGELPEVFAPSLFQEHLEKKYELRVFYLDGESYAMAIFSQNDPRTRVDFRHYNLQKPNRNVPYRLDERSSEGIRRLMQDLSLDTGSLDFIHTDDGRLVFLEVNPVGQLGMVSKPCNYPLERKIAESLIARVNHG